MNRTVKYADVVSGKVKAEPKQGIFQAITFVSWDGVEPQWTTHKFRTIGDAQVPLKPELPRWFRFPIHPEVKKLERRIKKNAKTATFEQLDMIMLDLEDLRDYVAYSKFDDAFGDYYIPWHERPDWCEWMRCIDDSWADLFDEIEELAEFAIPHMPWHSSREVILEHIAKYGLDCEPLTNRVPAPTLKEALGMMMAKADEFEKQKQENDNG